MSPQSRIFDRRVTGGSSLFYVAYGSEPLGKAGLTLIRPPDPHKYSEQGGVLTKKQ